MSEGVLCHDSVVKLKAPHLYEMQKNKGKGALGLLCQLGRPNKDYYEVTSHQADSVLGFLYYLYTEKLCCEVEDLGALELVTLALSFQVLSLARVVIEVMKLTREDSWTFVTGERDNKGSFFIASSVDMDVEFEDKVVPPVFIDCPMEALDFWDFKGIRLNGKTPRQVGMVEKEINFIDYDRRTVKLLKESSNEKEDLVMMDFEVCNLDTMKGVVMSPTLRGGQFLWRIKVEFPKKVTKGRDSEVGVYVVCEADQGGNEWYGDISGNLIVVNKLDRDRDIVKSVSSRLSDSDQSWGFSNMFKIKDIVHRDLGFVVGDLKSVFLKARVLVDNFEISNPGLVEIMKRRRRKQMKNSKVQESNVKVNQTGQKVVKLTKTNANGDGVDINKDFKQDICQSFSLCEVDENHSTGERPTVKDDDGKPEDDVAKTGAKKKRRKPVEKCHLPSCPENARHRCSACKGVRYCSQECSNQHWAVLGGSAGIGCRGGRGMRRRDWIEKQVLSYFIVVK